MECFMCKGELEKKKVNYFVDLENTIIIIKDVPAKVCKNCGEKFYSTFIVCKITLPVLCMKQLVSINVCWLNMLI